MTDLASQTTLKPTIRDDRLDNSRACYPAEVTAGGLKLKRPSATESVSKICLARGERYYSRSHGLAICSLCSFSPG